MKEKKPNWLQCLSKLVARKKTYMTPKRVELLMW